MNACARQTGFTLLELMIGLVLVSLLMVLLFGALNLASKSWNAGEGRLAESSSQVIVSGFVDRALSQANPLRFKHPEGQVLAFEGGASVLHYAGRVPTHHAVAGLNLISLELVDGELQMRWHPPGLDSEGFSVLSGAEKVVLLDHVKELEFGYFGATDANATPAWHDEWLSDVNMPQLVSMKLTPVSGPAWPTLVVPVMLPASANCLWDDFFKRCRDQMTATVPGIKAPPSRVSKP